LRLTHQLILHQPFTLPLFAWFPALPFPLNWSHQWEYVLHQLWLGNLWIFQWYEFSAWFESDWETYEGVAMIIYLFSLHGFAFLLSLFCTVV
jgi:hypothetical protein